MLAIALLLCLMQGFAILAFRDPRPTARATLDQVVEVAGVHYRLASLTVATELAAKPDEGPLVAPNGALLVRAVVQIEVVEAAKDIGTLYCTFSLIDDRRRRWTADFDVNYRAAGSEQVTCSGTEDAPVRAGQPVRHSRGRGLHYPGRRRSSVRLRLELPTDSQMIEFAR